MGGATLADRPTSLAEAVVAARLDPAMSLVVFRRLLEAVARPGRPIWMPSVLVSRLPPALLPTLTLADLETTVHVIEGPVIEGSITDEAPTFSWGDVVRTVTGARPAELSNAQWVTALQPITPDDIRRLHRGTALAPEDGTRLALRCTAARPSGTDPWPPDARRQGVNLVLEGPGVHGQSSVSVEGIDPASMAALIEANTGFPAGIDTWLIADTGVVFGLPRSTRIHIAGTWGQGGH